MKAIRDPEVEVAMRLGKSRRELIASVGEDVYHARAEECRAAIRHEMRRKGYRDPREAALALSERAAQKDSPASRVIATLLCIVAVLEWTPVPCSAIPAGVATNEGDCEP